MPTLDNTARRGRTSMLGIAAALVLALGACANSPAKVSRRTPEELVSVSDMPLCRAVYHTGENFVADTTNVVKELNRRNVDCSRWFSAWSYQDASGAAAAADGNAALMNYGALLMRQGAPTTLPGPAIAPFHTYTFPNGRSMNCSTIGMMTNCN